jgi:hypothetical protein
MSAVPGRRAPIRSRQTRPSWSEADEQALLAWSARRQMSLPGLGDSKSKAPRGSMILFARLTGRTPTAVRVKLHRLRKVAD